MSFLTESNFGRSANVTSDSADIINISSDVNEFCPISLVSLASFVSPHNQLYCWTEEQGQEKEGRKEAWGILMMERCIMLTFLSPSPPVSGREGVLVNVSSWWNLET